MGSKLTLGMHAVAVGELKCSAGLLCCGGHLVLLWGCKSGIAMMSMVGP